MVRCISYRRLQLVEILQRRLHCRKPLERVKSLLFTHDFRLQQ
jgi:hypothetical protein